MGENFDIIVVGSGASGAVLASRLTEDPALQVLLLEAGADLPPTGATDAMKAVNPLTLWGDSTYTFADAQARRTADQAARFYPVGRGLGGGSAMNGMGAIRPSRQDFESWKAEYGCEGWEWKDVLPCLCRLESDPLACSPQHSSSSFPSSSSVPPSSDDSCHGSNGPIPIYRQPVETWGPVAAAMRSAALSMGYTEATDLNHPDATGLCNFPYNVRASASQPSPLEGEAANASSKKNDAELRHDVLQRVSVVEGYLHAEVRARPNLTIRCDALVDRVVFGRTEASSSGGCAEQQPQRALGVMVVDVSSVASIPPTFVAARCEVVLCAGALHTPAILQRSGLGSFDRVLAPAGIEHRVVDLPAVGENLQDHPVINGRIPLEVAPHPESRHTTALLRFSSSGIGGSEEGDDSSERSDGSADDRFNDLYFVAVEHGTDPRAKSMASSSQTSSEGEAIDDSVTEAVGDSSSDAALPHSSTNQAVGFIDAMLMRVRSRGRVAVASRDPRACPATIEENMLSDPEDTLRMAYAVERLATLLSHDHVQHLLPKPSEGQQQQQERSGRRIIIGQPGSEALTVEEARQQASTAVASWQQASTAVSSTPSESAPLQASTTPSGVAEVKTGDATTANPAAALAAAANFSAWMRRNASDGIHMSGTCRMGPPEASSTDVVCDSRTLMVRGVLGLRVADASIMPTNVRANTVSERKAALTYCLPCRVIKQQQFVPHKNEAYNYFHISNYHRPTTPRPLSFPPSYAAPYLPCHRRARGGAHTAGLRAVRGRKSRARRALRAAPRLLPAPSLRHDWRLDPPRVAQ